MPKNVKCKNCNRLKNHWCKAVLDSPDEDMIRDCRHFWQKTNGDRIREMNDAELAGFIKSLAFERETPWCEPFVKAFCDSCPSVEAVVEETGRKLRLNECDFADGECPHGNDIVWWLKQPMEE